MNIKKILEIVFLPDWNTHAYICEGGDIWIQLMPGRCFNKEKFIKSQITFSQMGTPYKVKVIELFDALTQYYEDTFNPKDNDNS